MLLARASYIFIFDSADRHYLFTPLQSANQTHHWTHNDAKDKTVFVMQMKMKINPICCIWSSLYINRRQAAAGM